MLQSVLVCVPKLAAFSQGIWSVSDNKDRRILSPEPCGVPAVWTYYSSDFSRCSFFSPSCLVNGCGLSIHDAISLYSLISSACSAHLAVKHAEVVPLRGPSGKRSWRRRLHVIVAKRMFQPVSTLCCYRRRPTTHWWPQVFTLLSWCSFELTKPSPTLNTKRSRSHLRVNQSADHGAGVIGSMGGATLWR